MQLYIFCAIKPPLTESVKKGDLNDVNALMILYIIYRKLMEEVSEFYIACWVWKIITSCSPKLMPASCILLKKNVRTPSLVMPISHVPSTCKLMPYVIYTWKHAYTLKSHVSACKDLACILLSLHALSLNAVPRCFLHVNVVMTVTSCEITFWWNSRHISCSPNIREK